MRRNRWSDNDRNFGPFTYARDHRGYRPLAVILGSGCEEYPGASLRVSGFGHTLISSVPAWLVRPWRERVSAKSWDAETVARLGRDWYENVFRREYGFSYRDGFLQVFFGRQTHSSDTTQSWSWHLPWTQWRHVRRSLYGLNGEHVWTEPKGSWLANREVNQAAEDACPAITFAFRDFDGEALMARTRLEEREWRFGEGWFKWLSLFRRPRIRRYLDIKFSGETGRRKRSWKGGTIGHSIETLPGEMHEAAFRRYCAKNGMRFVGIHDPAVSTAEGNSLSMLQERK